MTVVQIKLLQTFIVKVLVTSAALNVLELGNKDLLAEESESISVGFAFSPTRNTTLTVDYWQFDHEDLVDTDMTAAA